MTLRRILDDTVLDAVLRVAGVEYGLVDHRELRRWNDAVRISVDDLAERHAHCVHAHAVPRRCAGDDAFEIAGITLRFGDGLASAGGTPVEERHAGSVAVERRDHRL